MQMFDDMRRRSERFLRELAGHLMQLKPGERRLFYGCAAVFFGAVLLLASPLVWYELTLPRRYFVSTTGWTWPHEARIISAGDQSFGGITGDGAYHLILDVDRATLADWLAHPPPWGTWASGPLPQQLRGLSSFGWSRHADEAGVPDTKQIHYAARDRLMDFNHGDLIVIDLENQRVWMSSWEY